MHTNTLKKFAALCAAATLSLGVVACGSNSGGSSSGDSSTTESTGAAGEENAQSKDKNGKEFNPSPASNESRIVSITAADGSLPTSRSEHDANGNFKISSENPGIGTVELYFVDGKGYNCTNGACAEDQSITEAMKDADMTKRYEEMLAEARSRATYVGEEDCDGTTCQVWEVDQQKFFLDNDGRMLKAEVKNTDPVSNTVTDVLLDVDYVPVTITAPEVTQ